MKLHEIKDWSDERLITQNTPDRNGYNAMITEELGEALESAINQDEFGFVDAICDISVFAVGEIYKHGADAAAALGEGHIADWLPTTTYQSQFHFIEEIVFLQFQFLEAESTEAKVEAMKNMVIASYRELGNMYFDADKCMDEVLKEINSRTGAYSEETKKWQKFKTPEAQALWYEADFTNCRLVEAA